MRRLLAPLLLVAAVLLAFWPVLDNGFVYDDEPYVTENPHVRAGFTREGLIWAWTSEHAANWHPLTWMSHMLDVELFGLHPRGHHATSLLLHLVNTLLAYFWLATMTGCRGRSFCVAALFAVHPLRVESVAWIAERKDVLSTLFWLLASITYVRHVRSGTKSIPWLSTVLMGIGLTAKPMLVTLPFTLLLLDGWPLRRAAVGIRRLLIEKLPMLALVVCSCVITLWAQRAGSALIGLSDLPFSLRAQNAIVAPARYLAKTFWPHDLAVFYPHPEGTVPWTIVLCLLAAWIAITVYALRERRSRPYLALGWLWFLVTLVPVLGFVQVGSQAIADRYTYVPLLGLFVLLVWGIGERLAAVPLPSARSRRVLGFGVFGVLLIAMASRTRAQARTWHDPVTLFEHAVSAGGESALMRTNLADALDEAGRAEAALAQYRAAIARDPLYSEAHNNLGVLLDRMGRRDEAIAEYREALRHGRAGAEAPEAHDNLARALVTKGDSLYRAGRVDEAVADYGEALRVRPELPEAWNNLGVAQSARGRIDEALASFDRAIALRPAYGSAHANRAAALYAKGDFEQARAEVDRARENGFDPPRALVDALANSR